MFPNEHPQAARFLHHALKLFSPASSAPASGGTLAATAAKDEGVTILLVLHELGELAPVLDRELHIRSGHFTYDGPARSDARDPYADHCTTTDHHEMEVGR